jgi:hypothetical protein
MHDLLGQVMGLARKSESMSRSTIAVSAITARRFGVIAYTSTQHNVGDLAQCSTYARRTTKGSAVFANGPRPH